MQTSADIQALQERISEENLVIQRLFEETGKVVIGQHYMIERLMIGLLTGGHICLHDSIYAYRMAYLITLRETNVCYRI